MLTTSSLSIKLEILSIIISSCNNDYFWICCLHLFSVYVLFHNSVYYSNDFLTYGGADVFLDLFVSSQSQTLSVFHRAHITQRCFYPFRIIPCDVIIDNLNEHFNCYSGKAPPIKHLILHPAEKTA